MNAVAPKGQVFVCAACGKLSKDEYGYQKISYGWDESCTLNSFLCYEEKVDGSWQVVDKKEDAG